MTEVSLCKLPLICNLLRNSFYRKKWILHCCLFCSYSMCLCTSVCLCLSDVDIVAVWYHLSCCHNNRSCSWWWCIVCQTISARTWYAGPVRLQTWFTTDFMAGVFFHLWSCLWTAGLSACQPLPNVVNHVSLSADYLCRGYSGSMSSMVKLISINLMAR